MKKVRDKIDEKSINVSKYINEIYWEDILLFKTFLNENK